MPSASDLASDLAVNKIPALAARLREYDEQNFQLQLRHDNLEEEITRVRRSIAHKQAQQVRFVEQLNNNKPGSLKRQRTEEEQPEPRMVRSRLQNPSDRRVPENFVLRSSDSAVSMGTKRRGRFFSNEEMQSATNF